MKNVRAELLAAFGLTEDDIVLGDGYELARAEADAEYDVFATYARDIMTYDLSDYLKDF